MLRESRISASSRNLGTTTWHQIGSEWNLSSYDHKFARYALIDLTDSPRARQVIFGGPKEDLEFGRCHSQQSEEISSKNDDEVS